MSCARPRASCYVIPLGLPATAGVARSSQRDDPCRLAVLRSPHCDRVASMRCPDHRRTIERSVGSKKRCRRARVLESGSSGKMMRQPMVIVVCRSLRRSNADAHIRSRVVDVRPSAPATIVRRRAAQAVRSVWARKALSVRAFITWRTCAHSRRSLRTPCARRHAD